MNAYNRSSRARWAPCLRAGVAASVLLTTTVFAQEGPSDEESEEPTMDPLPQEEGEAEENPFPEDESEDETGEPTEQRAEGSEPAEYPDLCSDTQPALYKGDCQTLQDGYLKYTPKFQLWADGEAKERFIYLPGGIETSNESNWEFPVGTVLYKTFMSEDGQQRYETRIIKKVADAGKAADWTFATWGWTSNAAAQPVTTNGQDWQSTGHNIPTIRQCDTCHRTKGQEIDPILGFTAIQLNIQNNQVMSDKGVFETLDASAVQTLSELGLNDLVNRANIPGNETTQKALGYMYANCSHCHGGPNPAGGGLDLSIPVGLTDVGSTPVWQTAVCKETQVFSPPDELVDTLTLRIGIQEQTNSSAVLWRMNTRVPGDGMPNLATTQVHPDGVRVVSEWIKSIQSCDATMAQ